MRPLGTNALRRSRATLIFSALLVFLVLLREMAGVKLPVLGSLGRNPLLLYMLHAVIGVILGALLGDAISAGLAWLVSFGVLGVCILAAAVLDRRGFFVKL